VGLPTPNPGVRRRRGLSGVSAGKVGVGGADGGPVQVALDDEQPGLGVDLLEFGQVEVAPFGVLRVAEAGVAEREAGGGVVFGNPPVAHGGEVVQVQHLLPRCRVFGAVQRRDGRGLVVGWVEVVAAPVALGLGGSGGGLVGHGRCPSPAGRRGGGPRVANRSSPPPGKQGVRGRRRRRRATGPCRPGARTIFGGLSDVGAQPKMVRSARPVAERGRLRGGAAPADLCGREGEKSGGRCSAPAQPARIRPAGSCLCRVQLAAGSARLLSGLGGSAVRAGCGGLGARQRRGGPRRRWRRRVRGRPWGYRPSVATARPRR
jgi:hypothetical protein